MTTKVRGDKVQALLHNQMSGGFADLTAAILRPNLAHGSYLDIQTDCRLISLLGKPFLPSTPFGQESVSRLLSLFARIWIVNIPIRIEQKDLEEKTEIFTSLQQL